jgi:BirA family biotin operon repressor/biotin-[acetyl-CoA-carboxylase] ligase
VGYGRKAGSDGARDKLMKMFRTLNFKKLTSTNDKAREFAKKGYHNLAIIAERQEKGRGRFNRRWDSDLGGLYMTLLLKENNLEKARYLTLIASVSVAKSIMKLSNLKADVKWPNDVLVNDKKICGILTETISGKESYALVGIGLNVNQKNFPGNLANKSTSLNLELNKKFDIKKVSNILLKEFNILYSSYKNKKYSKIIEIWKKYSHTLGKNVKVKTLAGKYTGKAVNIDKDCNLTIKLKNGKIRKITEGDIFVI